MNRRGFFPVAGRVILGQRALLEPTILLTNRSTYSDAEDFTEGYRALKLGKTVGEPTAGSVIFTNTVTLIDGTRMGLPTTTVRAGDGQNLEMHPRAVDIQVSRPVGEWYSGRDAQLDAAAAELINQIDASKPAKPAVAIMATAKPVTQPVNARSMAPATRPSTRPILSAVARFFYGPTTKPAPTTAGSAINVPRP
jgi:hypothetical protein